MNKLSILEGLLFVVGDEMDLLVCILFVWIVVCCGIPIWIFAIFIFTPSLIICIVFILVHTCSLSYEILEGEFVPNVFVSFRWSNIDLAHNRKYF